MSVADAKNVKKRRDPKTGDVYELVDGRWVKIDEKANPAAKVSPDNIAAADRSATGGDLVVRKMATNPNTWREADNSIEAVFCTDNPCVSIETKTGRGVKEVWLMSGLEFEKHIPVLNDHRRDNVREVLGSAGDCRVGEHEAVGRLYMSSAEQALATKLKEGHIKSVSVGGERLEVVVVPAGQSKQVGGQTYTADRSEAMNIVTRLRVLEVSLTAIGADPDALTRSRSFPSVTRSKIVSKHVRKFLTRVGMHHEASDEEAQKFHDALHPDVQKACRAFADEAEKDEQDEKDQEERKRAKEAEEQEAARKAAAEKEQAERNRAVADEVVRRALDDARKAEADRQAAIRKAGEGVVSEEVIRAAIDDGTAAKDAAARFLEVIRTRTDPVGPAIHSRSVEKDCTADVLGAAMVIRSLNSIPSGRTGATFASNPVNLVNRYRPGITVRNGVGDWLPDYPTRDLNEADRKRNEALFNMADRFRNMSLVDVCRHCCRLDGIAIDGFTSPSEVVSAALGGVIRAGSAPSGGAFGAIFTTNFNALFLAGYLEATDTTMGWTTEDDAPNFMPGEMATIGKMGSLTLDGKGPADQMTYGDWNEQIKVDRFAGSFEIDEKDLINDRFGALQTWSPQEMGLAARRVRPNLVYSILLNGYTAGTSRGPTLNQDNNPLFCSAHGNFLTAANNDLYTAATGAVGVAGLQKAIPAIQSQRLNGVPLNLRPRFILISPYLDFAIRTALFSTQRIIASGSGGTLNPLQMFDLEPRVDARLDPIGSVDPLNGNAPVVGLYYHYILVCRPGENGAKTMRVRYLLGTGRAPQVRSYVLGGPGSPGRWGMGWDVKLDVGAAPEDFRGFYYAESTT